MDKIIVDVREPQEYALGHVNGAINLPLSRFSEEIKRLEELSKDRELILYCQSGNRSGVAINILKSLGFTNLVNGINQTMVNSRYVD